MTLYFIQAYFRIIFNFLFFISEKRISPNVTQTTIPVSDSKHSPPAKKFVPKRPGILQSQVKSPLKGKCLIVFYVIKIFPVYCLNKVRFSTCLNIGNRSSTDDIL